MQSAGVRVPATSANLGSGYDAFGLALALHNQFSAELADDWVVSVLGEGADRLPHSPENHVARAMARVFSEAGETGQAARVFCTNRIPPGKGFGSSSAAIVGGMLMADALCPTPLGKHRIFELAVEMEGHPDNIAAALWGGFTICWDDGGPRCAQIGPEGGLAAVVVSSQHEFATEEARDLLPDTVPHADAAFCAGRAGLFAAAMAQSRADLIGPGLRDRMHQQYRAGAVPDIEAVCDALVAAGADGAALSGAGPTVIGLVSGFDDARALRRAAQVAEKAKSPLEAMPGRGVPFVLAVDREGAVLR